MTGSYIQLFLSDMRGDNLLIAVLFLNAFEKLFQIVAKDSTFREPQWKSLSYALRKMKKFHFFPDFSMVAFLGFFQNDKIFFQKFLFWERDGVNTRQLFILFIATPISTGYAEKFYGFYIACVWQVWSSA